MAPLPDEQFRFKMREPAGGGRSRLTGCPDQLGASCCRSAALANVEREEHVPGGLAKQAGAEFAITLPARLHDVLSELKQLAFQSEAVRVAGRRLLDVMLRSPIGRPTVSISDDRHSVLVRCAHSVSFTALIQPICGGQD